MIVDHWLRHRDNVGRSTSIASPINHGLAALRLSRAEGSERFALLANLLETGSRILVHVDELEFAKAKVCLKNP